MFYVHLTIVVRRTFHKKNCKKISMSNFLPPMCAWFYRQAHLTSLSYNEFMTIYICNISLRYPHIYFPLQARETLPYQMTFCQCVFCLSVDNWWCPSVPIIRCIWSTPCKIITSMVTVLCAHILGDIFVQKMAHLVMQCPGLN